LLIKGTSGIGKTVSIKRVLQDLDELEEADNLSYAYVNCWNNNSSFKILSEVCSLLGYKFTHNMNKSELISKISSLVKKKTGVIFVFDEVDKTEDYDFLYNLLEEIKKRCFLLITNDKNWGYSLDNRIMSRLMAETLTYPEYTRLEIYDILRERKKYAFYEGVWDKEAFDAIAKKSADLGDVRVGIMLLKAAGHSAENEASRKITMKHALEAIGKIEDFKIKSSDDFTIEEKKILQLCKKNTGKPFNELYTLYKEKVSNKSEKTFRRKLDSLEKKKLIKFEHSQTSHGRSLIVHYKGLQVKKLTDF
jgi:cell division control protein 6